MSDFEIPKVDIDAQELSWGRLNHFNQSICSPYWSDELSPIFRNQSGPFLAHGMGRSYGDVGVVREGILINMQGIKKILSFDRKTGRITCEAGVSLDDLLTLTVKDGWFLPVTPGTKFATIGGIIANDVHGKNHQRDGTIGRFVKRLDLLRSDGAVSICSPTENKELFSATIGGLGLTGIILHAEIQLIQIKSTWIDQEMIKFHSLDEFWKIDEESKEEFKYTVAWLDCMSERGRGIYIRGNHCNAANAGLEPHKGSVLSAPPAPDILLNGFTMKAFNTAYFHRLIKRNSRVHYDPFFYPLDVLSKWNRLYGPRGMFQYQLVIPDQELARFQQILQLIAASRMASFLAVLKRFGPQKSPGFLSFPTSGITLTLDFPNYGERLRALFQRLDEIVLAAGGRLYPAKDAHMSATSFQIMYPQWKEFKKMMDPKMTSEFWRRVTKT